MKKYDITESDQNLIKIALKCLTENFDDGIYEYVYGKGPIYTRKYLKQDDLLY